MGTYRGLAQDWHHDRIPLVPAPTQGAAEFAELGEYPPIDWDAPPLRPTPDETSANSASGGTVGGVYVQPAVLPAESILMDWYRHARQFTEGADCYLAGCIVPVLGAILGRRVWMRLAGGRKFPNIFALICGKPGDRKSTTIRLAAGLARRCLPKNTFLPSSFSPESLFDEYDEACDGRPDKLWIVDDANSVLLDWQKTSNGERNSTRFLELYDCAALSESFRRNKEEAESGESRRVIDETSTSVLFGGTFNVACFKGQSVRAGMARRFLYYVAERRGRDIYDSPEDDPVAFQAHINAFRRCLAIEGEMQFTPEAQARWRAYQAENREAMNSANPLAEDYISRLSSAPAQTLAVAMIFETALWAKREVDWQPLLSLAALEAAMAHVDACLDAARWLDGIANRASIAQDVEVLHARIQRDFAIHCHAGTIYATRSELTRAYCHDSSRKGALRPHELYHHLLPTLIAQNKARLVVKEGKREVYGFRVEG
ncbi:MAG TPA: DUF3987 domain-containing protein [Chthoniobacter sp.]|jgi:hypothetical protein